MTYGNLVVNTLDSKSSASRRAGSIPAQGTNEPSKDGNTSEFQKRSSLLFWNHAKCFF